MITDLGYGTLALTFLLSIYGILAAVWGVQQRRPDWIDSARNAMLLTFPLLTLSSLSLIYLLVNGHYEVDYVASVTSNSMPLYLRITAL
jgi:cytochrome c-type biogenesis protein CcmF